MNENYVPVSPKCLRRGCNWGAWIVGLLDDYLDFWNLILELEFLF